MNPTSSLKIASKVEAAIKRGYKKVAIAQQIGISRQTLDTRLKGNSFLDAEISALQRLGIIQ